MNISGQTQGKTKSEKVLMLNFEVLRSYNSINMYLNYVQGPVGNKVHCLECRKFCHLIKGKPSLRCLLNLSLILSAYLDVS